MVTRIRRSTLVGITITALIIGTQLLIQHLQHHPSQPAVLAPETSASPIPPRTMPTRASRTRNLVGTGVNASHSAAKHTTMGAFDPGVAAPVPTAQQQSELLQVTAYCATGQPTASGVMPQLGMAAGNHWPFGTRLRILELHETVTITDRIGHGSDLDLYLGHTACNQRARNFGRQDMHIEVLP